MIAAIAVKISPSQEAYDSQQHTKPRGGVPNGHRSVLVNSWFHLTSLAPAIGIKELKLIRLTFLKSMLICIGTMARCTG